MSDKQTNPEWSEDLNALGGRIAGLSRPTPPENLTAKTVAYVQANCAPEKKPVSYWFLKPITHPAARVAAAAVIVVILSPLTDLEMGASIGSRIEQRIIGPRMTDKLEAFVDEVLPSGEYTQPYFDSVLGVSRPAPQKKTAVKAQNRRV